MFLPIPAERLTPASEPELRFMETPEGVPQAIKEWWHPGETIGREFIYPKEQAQRLAKKASAPVLTTQRPTTTPDQTNTDDLTRISSTGQEQVVGTAGKTAPSAPRGKAQQGEKAPETITIKTLKVPGQPDGRPR